jgi:hypothetical protein
MGPRAWRARALAISVLGSAAFARAQQAPPRALPLSAPALALQPLRLPPAPELRLKWPLAPISVSYTESEVTGYANGPLQLFRAESVWLELPGVRLLTLSSAERAFELDCVVTCQPIVQRTVGVEARVLLPRFSPAIREPYVFFRQASLRTPLHARASGQWQAGFGGAF